MNDESIKHAQSIINVSNLEKFAKEIAMIKNSKHPRHEAIKNIINSSNHYIVTGEIPDFDKKTQYLRQSIELTEKEHEIYKILKIANVSYTVHNKYEARKKVLKVSGENEEIVFYPRADYGKIENLAPGIKYYFIDSECVPDFDDRTHKIVDDYNKTNDVHSKYEHLLIAKNKKNKIKLPDETIIQNLTSSLDDYLSENYPIETQLKHTKELMNPDIDPERKDYLISLDSWLNRCRSERDLRESNLVNNGEIPSFNWEPKPTN